LKIKSFENQIDLKIESKLKSINFEKLQRFSAFSAKSEKIRANFIKISKIQIATKFEKMQTFWHF